MPPLLPPDGTSGYPLGAWVCVCNTNSAVTDVWKEKSKLASEVLQVWQPFKVCTKKPDPFLSLDWALKTLRRGITAGSVDTVSPPSVAPSSQRFSDMNISGDRAAFSTFCYTSCSRQLVVQRFNRAVKPTNIKYAIEPWSSLLRILFLWIWIYLFW